MLCLGSLSAAAGALCQTQNGLSTQKHGCLCNGQDEQQGQRYFRQPEMSRGVSGAVPGNNKTLHYGADQRSADEHPLHRGRMWQDSPQHTCTEHASC